MMAGNGRRGQSVLDCSRAPFRTNRVIHSTIVVYRLNLWLEA
jgi:hypothetical protein